MQYDVDGLRCGGSAEHVAAGVEPFDHDGLLGLTVPSLDGEDGLVGFDEVLVDGEAPYAVGRVSKLL
ncbi:hypothetical protein ACGFY9_03295 [Streptomyces sp. NPDC048504]|uniref:hypothetical protein n=1 Tax=Streptomyces sp. NPDC048504 TaxID=3365559 RepID=UPI00371BE662